MSKKTYLLGMIDNAVITADVEITTRNGYEEFTASFNVGRAFDVDTIDEYYKKDYYEMLWDCYDADGKLDLLMDGERTKDDVFDNWSIDDDYRNIIDCSCTDYEIDLKDEKTKTITTYNFETEGCGQHDCRDDADFDKMIFTNKKAFNILMKLWDEKHLKEIDTEDKKQVEEIDRLLADYTEYNDAFYNFIEEHLKAYYEEN